MKRLIPSLFLIIATLALAQPAQAPTAVQGFAKDFAQQGDIAESTAILVAPYSAETRAYFLGRASAFRQAAQEMTQAQP